MAFNLDNISTANATAPSKKSGGETSILKKEIRLFGSLFSNKQKENFYTELSVLLRAGVNLKEALSLIEEAQKKKEIKEFLQGIITEIVAGNSFSETMLKRKEFTEYEYHSVKIGEETGTLERICKEMGSFFYKKNEQRRNLVSALTYPVIILVTAVLVLVFMLRFVVPMFQDIFKLNNVELPAITKMIIALSESLKSYGWLFLAAIVLFFVFRGMLKKKQWYMRKKDELLVRIPFLGAFVKTVYLAQFTQAVSLLSASRVPIVSSIQLVKKMIGFYPLQKALQTAEERILTGTSLSESLKGNKVFDNKIIALIKVAEETNQLDFIFERLNNQYNTELQQRSKLLSTVMEPLIIVFVGLLVGVILIAMYLPMFKLSSVLG
ncbi:type II secretion system F family protein [Leptobacterium flavescens]|uniref:Type II secretion system F family protein n=1 Tax=Leptobacterium flavescens TaxID=472055 RepID=A0A6P0UI00_9FLAO|nr:type II secretion system F family protein [Leptobacterium flavescens]NER12971.1 type II secretion system F family protein [Leptobacterium flavescens]